MNIINRLTIPSIPNAIGDITPIAFVKELLKIAVNTNPTINIDISIPNVTTRPILMNTFLSSFADSWFDRYAKNPGYKGKTHTAPSGANSPAKNDNQIFVNALTNCTCLVN